MRTGVHRIVTIGLGSLILAQWSPVRAEEPVAPPFAPGETLTYDVSWSVFHAGQVVAALTRTSENAQDPYEVVTTARSQGFVSLLFKVKNEFHSLFDPGTACSQRVTKKINEGGRHKETQIVFDTARRLAILDELDLNKPNAPPKHAENEIPECVEDVITAFYYLRRQPLRVGDQVLVPVNDGAKTYEVTVEVQAREQVQTPIGTRSAFRLEPKVFGGLYKRQGRMLIWMSDDAERLPLRIKATISAGAITGTLKSVTTPTSPPSSKSPAAP